VEKQQIIRVSAGKEGGDAPPDHALVAIHEKIDVEAADGGVC